MITFAIAFSAAALWALFCSYRTYDQRADLLPYIFRPDADAASIHDGLSHWHSVGYMRHLWQLFTFRDPAKLYPAEWSEDFHGRR